MRFLDAFKRGKETKGWNWFAEGCQEQLKKLFRLAEDVTRTTGEQSKKQYRSS